MTQRVEFTRRVRSKPTETVVATTEIVGPRRTLTTFTRTPRVPKKRRERTSDAFDTEDHVPPRELNPNLETSPGWRHEERACKRLPRHMSWKRMRFSQWRVA